MESIKQQLLEETITCCLIDKGRVWSSKEGLGGGSKAGPGRAEENWGESEGLGNTGGETRRCSQTGWIRRGVNGKFLDRMVVRK